MNNIPAVQQETGSALGTGCAGATTVYRCDDTVDGILTAVYLAWLDGTSHTDVRVRNTATPSFLEQYREVCTDPDIALKVAGTILQKLSEPVYNDIYHACLSDDAEKASCVYRFLQKAFRIGPRIMDHLQEDAVIRLFKLTRAVKNEAHHYLEFVRFQELANGVLASRIDPKANIVPLIAGHFSDRLFNENWIILDTTRSFAAIHRAAGGCILTGCVTEEQLLGFSGISDEEHRFQALWKRFFDTIAIDERINPELQRQLMPLRFRKYMQAEQQIRRK